MVTMFSLFVNGQPGLNVDFPRGFNTTSPLLQRISVFAHNPECPFISTLSSALSLKDKLSLRIKLILFIPFYLKSYALYTCFLWIF